MAGTNDAALLQAAEDIFTHVGTDIDAVFYPTKGDPVAVKINLEKEGGDEPDGYSTKASGEKLTIEGPRHILGKVPVAATQNRAGEKFILADGTTYEVTGINESDEFFVTCAVRICK